MFTACRVHGQPKIGWEDEQLHLGWEKWLLSGGERIYGFKQVAVIRHEMEDCGAVLIFANVLRTYAELNFFLFS